MQVYFQDLSLIKETVFSSAITLQQSSLKILPPNFLSHCSAHVNITTKNCKTREGEVINLDILLV